MSYMVENFQQQVHPTMEQLVEYIKNTSSCNEEALCLHLAECEDCRRHAEIISLLIQHLPALSGSMINIEQNNLIIDFIAGGTDKDKLKEIRLSIINDAETLQPALYYASHSNALNREVENKGVYRRQITGNKENNTLLIKMIRKSIDALMKWLNIINGKLSNWKWLKSKYFYVAVIVIFILLIILAQASFFSAKKKPALFAVVYRDNPVIEFTDNSVQKNKDIKIFNTVRVSVISGGKIKISWPEIKHVGEYTIQLQQNSNGKIVLLQRHRVSYPSAIFNFSTTNKSVLQAGRRYEWVLSGRTDTNKNYYTKGGFVLMNP